MDLTIKTKEDSFLRKKSVEVEEVNEEIVSLCQQMGKLMRESGGAGLSAIQIGKNIRLFVIARHPGEEFYVMINPKIISSTKDFVVSPEGCLSFPGETFHVLRKGDIIVKHTMITGEERELRMIGFNAAVVQHEIDHLDGILVEDRNDDTLRKLVEQEAKKEDPIGKNKQKRDRKRRRKTC